MNKNIKADFIKVNELYFGKVGQGIKNRYLKGIIDFVFCDKVRKKKISFDSFSVTFEDTEVEWYSNFMNGYLRKFSKVKCFFTKDNDNFIVYSVLGNLNAISSYSMPKETLNYIEQRKSEWQKEDKKWKLDKSSVKKTEEKKQFSLEYKGEYKGEEGDYNIYERTVFKGIDKVVFQAFVLKNSDQKVMGDIEKISHGIEIR